MHGSLFQILFGMEKRTKNRSAELTQITVMSILFLSAYDRNGKIQPVTEQTLLCEKLMLPYFQLLDLESIDPQCLFCLNHFCLD